MRKLHAGLREHLDSDATSLCHCWILTCRDGSITGFTDHDDPLQIDGVDCEAASGFQPTEAVSSLGLATDNQDVEGALSSESISEDDLHFGKYDDARIDIWLVNWKSPEQRVHLRTAILGEMSQADGIFKAELRGLTSLLDQNVGRSFSTRCDAKLGDVRCGVNLDVAEFKTTGIVSKVSQQTNVSCSGLAGFERNWFSGGLLTWLSGNNAGETIEVSASAETAVDALTLWKAMPHSVAVGDAFELTAGCDKYFASCKEKFSNEKSFRGFPHMPGSDFALSYAGSGMVHDGSPFVE